LTAHAQALGLVGAVRAAGCDLVCDADGVEVIGELPAPLSAALQAFFGEGEHRDGQATHRALLAVLRAPSLAVAEVLGLPVAWARLPLAYALTIDRKGVGSVFTTSRTVYDRENGRRPTWRLPELDALARAHDGGRARPGDFDRWLAAKQRGPWALTPELAGVLPGALEPRCSFGELFDGLGAQVVDVEVEGVAA